MWKKVETLSWTVGIFCLTVWSAFSAHHEIVADKAITQFEQELVKRKPLPDSEQKLTPTDESLELLDKPDTSFWAPSRLGHYLGAMKEDLGKSPEAIMTISSVGLKAPVFDGIDEWSLNAGVGLIPGTAELDAIGNLGVAGHRDGYFRVLKDVEIGDQISVQTYKGTHHYSITNYWIVDPEDVGVLNPTESAALTLVTCYPFYFVGNAPKRFIVRAELQESNLQSKATKDQL